MSEEMLPIAERANFAVQGQTLRAREMAHKLENDLDHFRTADDCRGEKYQKLLRHFNELCDHMRRLQMEIATYYPEEKGRKEDDDGDLSE